MELRGWAEDQFGVLLAELPQQDNAEAVAERIIAAFERPFDVAEVSISVGVSIGIASSSETNRDPDRLRRHARLALYAAQSAGRFTYRLFDAALEHEIAAHQTLKARLREALGRHEMELHYQPVVELKGGRTIGFEALMRWNHPNRGIVMPGAFIPMAEETGLIVPLGQWVLREACRQAAQWPDPVWVAVNLSPLQLRDPRLVGVLAEALQSSGLPARRLELEITETALLRDDEATLSVLHALRRLGVRIALDDFGTGYASLSYLRSFPFDKIKIDRSFIQDLPHSDESAAIVRAVTSMGRSLGLTITAEGRGNPRTGRGSARARMRRGPGVLFWRGHGWGGDTGHAQWRVGWGRLLCQRVGSLPFEWGMEGSGSFLKKEPKNFFTPVWGGPICLGSSKHKRKSFLVPFLKKDLLPCYAGAPP